MNRKLVIGAVAASALAVGGTTAAFAGGSDDAASAASASTTVQAQAQGDDDHGGDDRDGRDDRGDDDGRDDRGDDDRAEARALADAKLSAKQAIEAALGAVNGQVESVELEDEDGGPVWEADVLGANGTWHEVHVDAGSGKVLQTEAGDDD